MVWSVLAFVPISIFCYNHLSSLLFYIFLVISMSFIFLPNAFFDKIQLSRKSSFYTKLGVRFINKFTQNGTFLNRVIKRKYPSYKVVSYQSKKIKEVVRQTYMFEKFHASLCLFFMFTSFYALFSDYFSWGIVFIITNFIYNVYPVLLQQYIRTKLYTS
jgi:hypothetical protein